MARKNKGPGKKALFSMRRLCSAPKTSATEGSCGSEQVPSQNQERTMDQNNHNLNSPSFQGNEVTRQSCTCGKHCLGPLTFHPAVKGQHVNLSAGDRRASRNPLSFRHGVTFSNRPLQIGEKVCIRMERSVLTWHGALRIGLTSVPPGSGPMCSLAIPDLTDQQGFWGIPIPENHCFPGTELTFWVTRTANLRVQTDDGFEYEEKMLQLDTSKPIWAMIDVYGQTSAVLLLGSEKKTLFSTRRSCAAPEIGLADNCGYEQFPEEILDIRRESRSIDLIPLLCQSDTDNEEFCVVCLSETASVQLDCGHSCLCSPCALRIIRDFGMCPLCRQGIGS